MVGIFFAHLFANGGDDLLIGERAFKGHGNIEDEVGVGRTAHHAEIDPALDRVTVLCLDIEHLTGKEAIELTRMRGEN